MSKNFADMTDEELKEVAERQGMRLKFVKAETKEEVGNFSLFISVPPEVLQGKGTVKQQRAYEGLCAALAERGDQVRFRELIDNEERPKNSQLTNMVVTLLKKV